MVFRSFSRISKSLLTMMKVLYFLVEFPFEAKIILTKTPEHYIISGDCYNYPPFLQKSL